MLDKSNSKLQVNAIQLHIAQIHHSKLIISSEYWHTNRFIREWNMSCLESLWIISCNRSNSYILKQSENNFAKFYETFSEQYCAEIIRKMNILNLYEICTYIIRNIKNYVLFNSHDVETNFNAESITMTYINRWPGDTVSVQNWVKLMWKTYERKEMYGIWTELPGVDQADEIW